MTDENDFSPGDMVVDRDDDAPDSAVVVNCVPGASADEWDVPGEQTLAEANPDYPEDASVIVVVFEDDFENAAVDWNRAEPLPFAELNAADFKYYSFPASRLVRDQKRTPALTDIQYVGESRAEDLREAGYESVADVTAADKSRLADIDGIGPTRADQLIASAGELLGNEDPDARKESGGESDTDAGTSRETSDGSDADRNLSAAIVALSRYLDRDGMGAEIADDGQSVRVANTDESYRVSLDSGVEGDGPHRSQLEEAVEKVRAATEATNE